jgi:hypothetical protein
VLHVMVCSDLRPNWILEEANPLAVHRFFANGLSRRAEHFAQPCPPAEDHLQQQGM